MGFVSSLPILVPHGLTAIEATATSCVLVRTRPGPRALQVSDVYGAQDGERFPLDHDERVQALRRIRRARGFPKSARLVSWDVTQATSPEDASVRAIVAPFAEAGFRIDEVIPATDALARLARQRRREPGRGGTAWLSLNRHAVAIAIVRGGELLFSHVFPWNYRPAKAPREELLQRYLLVAHLAPELRHGIDVVRMEHGASVDGVVTCGDLPDLRSLTMPLIEELDMEVETLDSLEGLDIVPPANTATIGDKAPALRLASAVAGDGEVKATPSAAVAIFSAAIATALISAIAWVTWRLPTHEPEAPMPATTQAERQAPPPPPPAGQPDRLRAPEPSMPIGGTAAEGARGVVDGNVPAATTGVRNPAPPRSPDDRPAPERSTAGVPSSTRKPNLATRESPGLSRGPAALRRPNPLTASLPTVNSILVSPERRLAVLDGAIVREGDAVGPRVLQRIERDAVVLREPSGYEVRVPIKRRFGREGSD
jgi:hypothetical protein